MFRMLLPACLLLLAACAAPAPTSSPERARATVEDRVRAPSALDDEELQVFGLRNSAVTALGRQASQAEGEGDLEQAEQLLERALRIDARDPAILQQMAELQLARGRFDQAESFASRSFELGPRVGQICRRSLRTLIIVHERNSRWDQAYRARDLLEDCRVAPPERF